MRHPDRPAGSVPALAAAIAAALLANLAAPPAPAAEPDHADHAPAAAGDTHDHATPQAGPNGGRIITAVEPHLEFLVTAERRVRITPVDEAGKPAAPAGLSVRLIGGSRANPTRMSFEAKDGALVSDIALPAGNNIPVVLQIKASAEAATVFEKFNLNLDQCPTCEHPEYACTCAHAGEHDGHDRE